MIPIPTAVPPATSTPYGGMRPLVQIVACVGLYALLIGLASVLWPLPALLVACYALMSALMLWRWHHRSDVLYFVVPAILGPLGEFVAVSFGAWHYTLAWLNIPLWLPLAWGVSGLCMKRIADAVLQARSATPARWPRRTRTSRIRSA